MLDFGPIPWTATSAYADSRKLETVDRDELEHMIRVIDNRYLAIQEKKRKAEKK